ncbi:MAG: type II toxin-antitoxin system prevent-host-death family antitoxin [Gammaproteobacteria bacterium]|nr:type II toxin-antitoxin system prevent-host-death family antitoxin [Gammaproteobacteria bacterium]
MRYSISALRANLYKIIDQVLETGVPVEVVRRGRRVRIIPDKPRDKLACVREQPDLLIGDPEDIVHLEWSDQWRP